MKADQHSRSGMAVNVMPQSEPELNSDRIRHRKIRSRIGIALILISGVLWFSLFAIPFLPLTVGQKAAFAGTLFVAVQIAWWAGAALAGPQLVSRLWPRRRVNKRDDR